MAQILQPFQVAVSNFSDSINSFFGVGEAPHTPQPLSAVAVSVVENDPHYFSAARWLQEIESIDTNVSIRGLCSLAMLVVDADVLRRLESSVDGASSDYSMLLLVLIQKCSHPREDIASCACWALSEMCESDTSVEIVLSFQSQMDKLFSSMLTLLSWTSTEAPVRAASLVGRLSRSTRFESVLGAETGRCISYIRALASLFSNSNQDVASCSLRCCWELLRGSSQGSMSLFLSLLLEESNTQLLKTLVSDSAQLLNASNAYLSIQSTLILNQILAVRDAPALLASLSLLKPISESCCSMIASADAKSSFHQLPVQLQVGCLRLVLRACADADCLASVRRSEAFDDLKLQLQQASLASNKQVSAFATKVVNLLMNENSSETTGLRSSALSNQIDSTSASQAGNRHSPQETVAPSSVESIFAHGKALRSTMIKESPSVYLNAAATQALAEEFRVTSGLLVEEQTRAERLASKVLLLELELQQKELQNQSLLDESRAVAETLSNADAAIRQLQQDVELRDSQLLAAANTSQVVMDKDREIASLKADLETQQYRSEAFSEEIARLRHERLDLIKTAGSMEQVKTELSAALAMNASLQRQLHEREQLLVTLQQQLTDVTVKDLALTTANASIATLERSIRQQLSDLETVTAANQKLQEDLHARDQLLILAHTQATNALESIAAVESAAGHSQSQEFAGLMAIANQDNANLRTRTLELESRILELENRLAQLSRECAGKVEDAVSLAASEKSALEQQIRVLENRLKEQAQEAVGLSEVQAAHAAQHEVDLKVAAAKRDVVLTRETIAVESCVQETSKLSQSSSEALVAKLKDAEAMISSASERETLLLAQQSQFDAEISSLRLQIADLKAAAHSSSEALVVKLKDAEAMISSASERETLLLAQQSQFDAEISSLRLQIADLKAASHPGVSVWADYQEKSALELALEEESKSLRAQLESQLSDFQSIMDAKDHIIQQLTDQVKKLQQQVDDAQAVNQVNSNTITSQSSIIGNLQSQIDQFSAQNAAAQNASGLKPLEVLMELESIEQENSSLKIDIANKTAAEHRLSEEIAFLRNRMADLERQAASDTRELEALHAETLHMRSLCLDFEAKCNSDSQVLSSIQREKQLLVMQNSQLLAMQSSMRNSRSSFESKGELAQLHSNQRRSHDLEQALSIAHGARRSSPQFFEPIHSSSYFVGSLQQERSQNSSRASPTFASSDHSRSSVYDVPVPSPLRASYNQERNPERRSAEYLGINESIDLYHA